MYSVAVTKTMSPGIFADVNDCLRLFNALCSLLLIVSLMWLSVKNIEVLNISAASRPCVQTIHCHSICTSIVRVQCCALISLV
jgi:hypothetical protein